MLNLNQDIGVGLGTLDFSASAYYVSAIATTNRFFDQPHLYIGILASLAWQIIRMLASYGSLSGQQSCYRVWSTISRWSTMLKGNMHHKHDVTDIAAGIYFWKFCTISYAAAKRRLCLLIFPPPCPHIFSSLYSYFLNLRLIFPPPWTDMCKRPAAVLGGGNLSQKRRKCDPKEEEKSADKKFTFSRPLCLRWKFFTVSKEVLKM